MDSKCIEKMPISSLSATFPFKLISPNVQEHWTAKHKRNRKHAMLLKFWWNNLKDGDKMSPPCTVTIIRIAPRAWDDDNLVTAAKNFRDAIGDLLRPGMAPGQADGKGSGITWEYKQEKGEPKQYAVRIEIITTIDPMLMPAKL